MPKKIDLHITEDLNTIKKLYQSSTTELKKDRLKMLYYIKNKNYSYRSALAQKLGRRPTTIGTWVKRYEREGLSGLIHIKSGGNNTKIISKEAIIPIKH